MSKINDGGPAFPTPEPQAYRDRQGMSLRDWFAGRVIGAANFEDTDVRELSDETMTEMAVQVYRIADAMLRARSLSKEEGEE